MKYYWFAWYFRGFATNHLQNSADNSIFNHEENLYKVWGVYKTYFRFEYLIKSCPKKYDTLFRITLTFHQRSSIECHWFFIPTSLISNRLQSIFRVCATFLRISWRTVLLPVSISHLSSEKVETKVQWTSSLMNLERKTSSLLSPLILVANLLDHISQSTNCEVFNPKRDQTTSWMWIWSPSRWKTAFCGHCEASNRT